MLTWNIVISFYILMNAINSVARRWLTLKHPHIIYFFSVMNYVFILTVGVIYVLITEKAIPELPMGSTVVLLLIGQAIFITISWLLQLVLIRRADATTTSVLSNLLPIFIILISYFVFKEKLTASFFIGTMILLLGSFLAVKSKQDNESDDKNSSLLSIFFISFIAFGFLAIGTSMEKAALDIIGVGSYVFYGWGMQIIVSILIFVFMHHKEKKYYNKEMIIDSTKIGVFSGLSATAYLIALSLGSFASTNMAAIGKVAIVLILSYFLLNEKDNLLLKIVSIIVTFIGLTILM